MSGLECSKRDYCILLAVKNYLGVSLRVHVCAPESQINFSVLELPKKYNNLNHLPKILNHLQIKKALSNVLSFNSRYKHNKIKMFKSKI